MCIVSAAFTACDSMCEVVSHLRGQRNLKKTILKSTPDRAPNLHMGPAITISKSVQVISSSRGGRRCRIHSNKILPKDATTTRCEHGPPGSACWLTCALGCEFATLRRKSWLLQAHASGVLESARKERSQAKLTPKPLPAAPQMEERPQLDDRRPCRCRPCSRWRPKSHR